MGVGETKAARGEGGPGEFGRDKVTQCLVIDIRKRALQ